MWLYDWRSMAPRASGWTPKKLIAIALPLERGSIVPEAVVSPLTTWQSFYVIMGSSAAALTGLMFIVVTLIAEVRPRSSSHGLAAFSTPTVVHFCAALLLSAILSAPWQALSQAGLVLGFSGLAGVTYAAIAVRRVRRSTGYRPDLEDWLWYAALPLVAYTALVVAAIVLPSSPAPALFGIGAVTVLLLFIGIRNAWDTVTYVGVHSAQPKNESHD
jgi:hypothetical protein